MEMIKWPEKVTNEQVLESIGQKINNILHRKANWMIVFEEEIAYLMPLKDKWRKWKEQEEDKHSSVTIKETEEDIGR